MKLRIVSDGTVAGTKLFDANTNQLWDNKMVTSVELSVSANDDLWRGKLGIIVPELDVIAEVEPKDVAAESAAKKDDCIHVLSTPMASAFSFTFPPPEQHTHNHQHKMVYLPPRNRFLDFMVWSAAVTVGVTAAKALVFYFHWTI
jgi:hypothetical protein